MKEYIIQAIAQETIDSFDAHNAPELVRCKDCKYGEKVSTFKYYPDVTWCNKYSTSHNDDWYCADGERAVKLDG